MGLMNPPIASPNNSARATPCKGVSSSWATAEWNKKNEEKWLPFAEEGDNM